MEGGRHPGRGTANRIVPLGSGYLEIIGVVDPVEAADDVLGRFLLDDVGERDVLIGWALGVDDVSAEATRLDLRVSDGSRERPDGTVLRWRTAGFEEGRWEPCLPFFIEWRVPPALHPSAMAVSHDVAVTGIAWVELSGDEERILRWVGPEVPIRVMPGIDAIVAVGISLADGGEMILP